VTTVLDGLEGPNALAPDHAGNLWISESRAGRVRLVSPAGAVVDVVPGGGAPGANGLVYDRHRRLLFLATGLGEGDLVIQRVAFDAAGRAQAPAILWRRTPGNADGLAMDACGHLYVVDNSTGEGDETRRVWRVRLDAAGARAGEPEVLAEVDKSATSAAFGVGPGFDATRLYVTGFDGTVVGVPVGVPGARVPIAGP
jgi:sugar lactone lactonase YvrE